MNAPLLEVRGLTTAFHTDAGSFNAVDTLDLSIEAGRTLGLVGESGCGKSVTALSVMGLISSPGKVTAGEVLFEGTDLLRLPPSALRDIRGNRISMIFQEPMTSLNPVFTVGYQLIEVLRLHMGMGPAAARKRAIALLDEVGIPDPEFKINAYPSQMSGGQQQRVMIAMAMAIITRCCWPPDSCDG